MSNGKKMSVKISFCKEEATDFVRNELEEKIETSRVRLLITDTVVLAGFLLIGGTFVAMLIGYFLEIMAEIFGYAAISKYESFLSWISSPLMVILFVVHFVAVGSYVAVVLCKRIRANKTWQSGMCKTIEDVYSCFELIMAGSMTVDEISDYEKMYERYCDMCEISTLNILETVVNICSDKTVQSVVFRWADADGDVFEKELPVDETILNINVETDTIFWEDGEVIYIKKYRG